MASKLYFKWGTMNSGKSMFLLATAFNFQERGVPFICIKPNIDNREDENKIHSRSLPDRDCVSISNDTDIFESVKTLSEVKLVRMEEKIKWILVDESQFLTEKQVEELSDIVDYLDINVMCFGLRTDFRTKLFSGSKRLFELADTLEEIKSTCSCGEKNIVNARLDSNGNIIDDGEQIMIGGEDKYLSMCRKCYKDKINEKK